MENDGNSHGVVLVNSNAFGNLEIKKLNNFILLFFF
jgi:hypothetical protein